MSPSSNVKSIVFSYHSSLTLTVPSSSASHGIEYSRIPCDTMVVFSMPDSVKWSGKRSSRNQRQSYLLIGSFPRMSSWNCTRKKWTWFACQSLRCESVFDCRKFSFFCYDARHIQGFSIFAPLTDLNVVLPAGTLQTIPLKD